MLGIAGFLQVTGRAVVPSMSVDKKFFWEEEVKQIERGFFFIALLYVIYTLAR